MKLTEKISTLEMEIALMIWVGILRNTVVPNVFWSFFNHEVDLLSVTKSGYATEIEIKISKSDLKKDADKPHHHNSNMIKYFYFAVPDYLEEFAMEHIPERAGLLTVSKTKRTQCGGWYSKPSYYVKKVRHAKIGTVVKKWTDADMLKLNKLGTLRILGLKKKVLKYKEGESE